MTERSKPSGTIAFLFTDIEGSTKKWQAHGAVMGEAVARHDAIVRNAISAHDGHVFKTVGDAFCAVFETTERALLASVEAQRRLARETWIGVDAIRVRMAIHVGVAEEREDDYFGPAVNRTARLLSAGHGGQILLSLPAAELIADNLPRDIVLRDLGEHRLKDLDRAEHIYQVMIPELASDFAPLVTVDALPNNLPLELTPFIGRSRELDQIHRTLLRPGVRLLTLTGPGGIGKTRLSLQAVAEAIDEFPDGAYFVPLAAINDSELVVHAIAEALVVREVAGQSLINAIRDHLRRLTLVLLLDNFEHVVDAARLLPSLLRDCPNIKIVVTSRSVLRVSGEHEIAVPTLSMPELDRGGKVAAERAMTSDAVKLFVSRAKTVRAEFDLTDDNATSVVEICRKLDGLPLAIELAAARVRMLSPQAMLPRLISSLKLLTGGGRDLPERQQTLRGAIAWSYDLLLPEQQKLLARMSVFSRGATFDSAEVVCSGGDSQLDEVDVFDGIGELVDRSLLRQDSQGEDVRYSMLETIREFALEQLDQMGEATILKSKHAEHFLDVAELIAKDLTGSKQAQSVRKFDAEIDNLRGALAWALESGSTDLGLRLGRSMNGYWQFRGLLSEGRTWLERVLAQGNSADPTLRARVLNNLGNLANDLGDYTLASSSYEESLAVWREAGDRRAMATVLNNLGQVTATRGDYARARELHSESLAIRQSLGDQHSVAIPLHNLGVAAHHEGDFEAACRFHEEALSIRKRMGDLSAAAYSTCALAHVLHHMGNDEAASRLFHEGVTYFRDTGDRVGLALSLGGFAEVAREAGRDEEAGAHFVEALTLWQEIGARRSVSCLEEVAAMASARRLFEPATRLLAAATAIRDHIGEPTPPVIKEERKALGEQLVSELGQAAFDLIWSAGYAIDPDTAIIEAIAVASID